MKTGKLKLTHHLEYRINEMWSVVSSLISSGVRFLHPNQIITLHQSLVVPKLLYGIEILHLTATDREHLNRQSRSALKQLFGVSKHAKNLIDRFYRLDNISTQLDKRRLNVIHQLTQNNDTWNYMIYMLSIPNQKRNFSILNSLYKTCVEHSTDFVKCLLNRTKKLDKTDELEQNMLDNDMNTIHQCIQNWQIYENRTELKRILEASIPRI